MTDKITLSKITLTTKDGQSVDLTIDEAKDLHAQLHELFGQKVTYAPYAPIVIERDRYPYWAPYRPVWGAYSGAPIYPGNTITCKANSGLMMSYSGNAA